MPKIEGGMGSKLADGRYVSQIFAVLWRPSIVGLADAAQKIGEVVASVTQIASQTGLLALNATIKRWPSPAAPPPMPCDAYRPAPQAEMLRAEVSNFLATMQAA